ncbi:MAG: hypothetical protein ACYDBQ_11820 [Thermoplasmatota archaeon]
MLDAIAAQPGIPWKELARRLGSRRGALEFQPRLLEAAGQLVRPSARGYACLFRRESVHRMNARPTLQSAGGVAVLMAVAHQPGTSFRSLARRAGLARRTVEHHVHRIMVAGLIRRREGGGLCATDAGHEESA